MKNKKLIFSSIVALLILFIGAAYLYKENKAQQTNQITKENTQILKRGYSYVLGNKDAKVELVEFFDPACGSCAFFHPFVKKIMDKHKGDIKLVFRYAPFHKNSEYAVKMLEGAREQGKFIETLEFMYSTQSQWVQNHAVSAQTLYALLATTDLDMTRLANFLSESNVEKRVTQDLKDTETLKINKTPTYYVNGRILEKFSLKSLEDLINSEL